MDDPGRNDTNDAGELADVLDGIRRRRADPVFQARIRRMIEEEAPVLQALADDDGPMT